MNDYQISDISGDAPGPMRLATLLIDARAVNPLSLRFQRALDETLTALEAQAQQLAGVIVCFEQAAPAAQHEFDQLIALSTAQAGDCMATLTAYHALLRRLEQFTVPVLAALTGDTEGHALALALACPRRLALAGIGLRMPQVTWGLPPSGGAIARAVRCIGLQAAMPLLLDGAPLTATQALQAGLLHGVADDETALLAQAHAMLAAGTAPRQPWDEKTYRMPGGTPSQLQNLLMSAPAMLREQTGGHYPAPEAILCAMVEGAQVDFANALLIESRFFCHIACSAVAKNMLRLARQRRAGPAPQAGPFSAALLSAYHAEAHLLAAEGMPPALLANAARAAGMCMAPESTAPQDTSTPPAPAGTSDAGARLLMRQCLAALQALERGDIASPEQADLASVELCGFPAFTGGAIAYIAHLGAIAFEAHALALLAAHGARFKLPVDWQRLRQQGALNIR
ncbi:enoyl-CoA hydratase/carnithine racemase [Oxalobacteraceae bacterium GrIS 1.11]